MRKKGRLKKEKEKGKKEEEKVYKGVFEKTTNESLFRLASKKKFDLLESPVKIGKESNVFSGISKIDHKTERVAIKIYRILECNFNRMRTYLSMDSRFRMQKSKRSIVITWAKREYKNLFKAYEAGVSVPKPLALFNNVLIMEFIGEKSKEKHPICAPLIKENPGEPKEMFKKLIKDIRLLYHKAGLIHGDLSEFNILNHNNKPVIIDLSHATPIEDGQELFERDVKNICRFFNKQGLNLNPEKLAKEIKSKK